MNSILLLACWTTFLLVTAWLGTTGRRDPYWHVIEVRDDWVDLAEAVGVVTPGEAFWADWHDEVQALADDELKELQ